jgi:hypothetical protein
VIAILVVGAGWFALTASYPMAFDESFHMGIIQIYSRQLSPILMSTPLPGYGGLANDPSYLFHYLMSFPYRLISSMTHEPNLQVISMRFLNIALFAAGLVGYRKLLLRFTISPALIHFSLLMLVLLPVTPFLAAHINYDNLIFLLTPINLWFVLNCVKSIEKGSLNARDISIVIILGALTSLVKYAYLPIYVACLAYIVGVWLWSSHRKKVIDSALASFRALSRGMLIGLTVAFIVSSGLFLQRYAVNLIQFHRIQPDCAQVEPLSSCLRYGPWARDYGLAAIANSSTSRPEHMSLPEFIPSWVGTFIYKLYFAINYDFREYSPMPLPIATAHVVSGVGLVLSLVFCRSIWRQNRHLALFVLISLVYLLSLLSVNYPTYLRLDKAVAVNGRYLMPFLPFMFVILALSYRELLTRIWRRYLATAKVALAIAVTFLALQGGGAMTYLIHSEPVWYWQGGPLTSFNTQLQKVVTTLVIGAKK